MKIKKITIIGMGLIGGSIGKALIEKGLAKEVVGVCRRESSLKRAVKEKSLIKGYVNNYEEAAKDADIIFIATPVHIVKKVLDGLAKVIKNENTIVTDVGSTKKEIVKYAAKFKKKFIFIGGHPLAGSEKAGVEYSNAGLYKDSVCVLTPSTGRLDKNGKKLKKLWKKIGVSTISVMSPEKHDKALAFSSHLPHVAAYALAGVLEEKFPKTMFATGFKDTTRIASSDEVLWSDIFMSNRKNVLKAIKMYKKILSGLEKDIRNNKVDELQKRLKKFKGLRDDIL